MNAKPTMVALAIGLVGTLSAFAAPTYSVTQLPLPAGYVGAVGARINDEGQVFGLALRLNTSSQLFGWRRGQAGVTVYDERGVVVGGVAAVNAGGVAVGIAGARIVKGGVPDERQFGYTFKNGLFTFLPDKGGAIDSQWTDINDRGESLGWARKHFFGEPKYLLGTNGGTPRKLGSSYDGAVAINNAGTMVGRRGDGNLDHSGFAVEADGTLTYLKTPQSAPHPVSSPTDINKGGQITGWVYARNDAGFDEQHIALWETANSEVLDLGALPRLGFSHRNCTGRRLNDAAEIVGTCSEGDANDYRGIYVTKEAGVQDLLSLIDDADPVKADIIYMTPTDINNKSEIVATAYMKIGLGSFRVLVLAPQAQGNELSLR